MKGQERKREGHKHVEVGKHRNWLEGNQRYSAEEGSKAKFFTSRLFSNLKLSWLGKKNLIFSTAGDKALRGKGRSALTATGDHVY